VVAARQLEQLRRAKKTRGVPAHADLQRLARRRRNRRGIGAVVPEWEAEMEMRCAGKFQEVVGRARSLWLFTRAGARAPYLVCEFVQNGARGILFAALAILARLLERPKRTSGR
jgi:hypothetical protein